jgi:hypothetical protein
MKNKILCYQKKNCVIREYSFSTKKTCKMAKTRQQKKFTDVVVRCKCAHFRSPSVFFPLVLTSKLRIFVIFRARSFVRSCEALVRGGTTDGVASAFSLSLIGGVGHFRAYIPTGAFTGPRDRGYRERERDGKRALQCAVQRGCQRGEKKAGAVRALSLCTAHLEIMELTIIIIIITTVDSPVLNLVRGQNFSCCSYSTLSLSLSHSHLHTLLTYFPCEVWWRLALPPPSPSPPTQSKDLCYLPYWPQ